MNFLTKNPFFYFGGGVFFHKLTRNPNLIFLEGGEVGVRGRVSVRA